MKYLIYSFLIFNFLIFSISESLAQDSLKALAQHYEMAEPSLEWTTGKMQRFGAVISGKQLQENALVVVLRTQSKRLKKLGILSRSSETSGKQRYHIISKIEAIKNENKLINTALISGFTIEYGFSDVYFVYDSSLTNLKNGVTNGIFVDNNGEIDNSIQLKQANFYICNYTLVSASNEAEGLVIYNSKMERVKHPFPGVSVAGSSGFNMLLQLLTSNDNHYKKKIKKDVAKLQRNFENLVRKGEKEFKKP